MAVTNSLYLFEVVVEKVLPIVDCRLMVIKADFGEIFSLELKDPKTMHIVIPDPPPLPPEPPGKKKGKPKPKPKKGKKGAEPPPPPEPRIQSGQSVLFTSNAEVLTQNMHKYPMHLALWAKEKDMTYIGSADIPWDPKFFLYLESLYLCKTALPPTVRDSYNIFQEENGKLMANIIVQVKLTYLTEKIVSSFRTLSEEPVIKKLLYTGMNSKTTSYICNLRTTDEEYEENMKKIGNNYQKDIIKPTSKTETKINFASFKNADTVAMPFFEDGDYCCMKKADKCPEDKYSPPEKDPDIDYICDHVRNIITSCNDNMRMLTPRPTIKPRVRATDMDKLCYCREINWPSGELADRFRKETQEGPCPVCTQVLDGKPREGTKNAPKRVINIANITGPCGRPDCRIARDLRAYLEKLLEEENREIKLDEIIGPCGSKSCTLVDKIKDFLRHTGKFKHGTTAPGLSTQCTCLEQMQNALIRRGSCTSICSHDCEGEEDPCMGKACPYSPKSSGSKSDSQINTKIDSKGGEQKVYWVFYFTVEYDKDPPSEKSPTTPSEAGSKSKTTSVGTSSTTGPRYKFCKNECPTAYGKNLCSKSTCNISDRSSGGLMRSQSLKCINPTCPTKEADRQMPRTPSPADSDIELKFDEIRNPCCVQSCDVAEKVKDFIVKGLAQKTKKRTMADMEGGDPCFCDCDCNFKFTSLTTYCPICGGYECLGDDVKDLPAFLQPHPCPVYNKIEPVERAPVSTKGSAISRDALKSKTISSRMSMMDTKRVDVSKPKESEKAKKILDKFLAKKKKKSEHFLAHKEHTEMSTCQKRATHIHHFLERIRYFRPGWRPGAANKILVRRYRTVREGVDIILKKKRALMNKKKKIEMKPTLVVTKKDGEYTVQMEVFKKYSKDRLRHQYPYDEKPPLIYTVGKTENTKERLRKKHERRERRESRRKSRLLQSVFRDKCQEICLKAYNQSIGLLPMPDPNNPECPCDIQAIKQPSPVIDSCSCSESGSSLESSDTDDDEWVIEFTPPMARWDIKAKNRPTFVDNDCQYNYLDYKVKCLDKQGNQVPRFFKGPDGNMECSDLGGFYGLDKQWLEIGKDGYIGPDNRWVPLSFTGPDDQIYSSEEGHFTDRNGMFWKIGIDGYVDKDGKWQFYCKRANKGKSSVITATAAATDSKKGKKDDEPRQMMGPQVQPRYVNNAHAKCARRKEREPPQPEGKDTKKPADVKKGADTKKPGEVDKVQKKVTLKGKGTVVMNVQSSRMRQGSLRNITMSMDSMKKEEKERLDRYQSIMNMLQEYEDIAEIRPPAKTNRAVETRQAASNRITSRYLNTRRNIRPPSFDTQ